MADAKQGGRIPPNPNAERAFKEEDLKTIYLAGGCFWGVETFIARVPGVAHTNVGYANGTTESPTYQEVCEDDTGHAETVQVRYDPRVLPLEKVLEAFFSIIDPTSKNRQGNDIGSQYRTGVYFVDPADQPVAQNFFAAEQARHDKPLAVELLPLTSYTPAEEHHQKYLEKNPNGYCHINFDKLKTIDERPRG